MTSATELQVKREDLNPCTVQLDIVCDPETVKKGYEKAFKEASKHIKVPGFRPGHAPRAIVEQNVNPQELNRLAVDNILNSAYKKAIEQEKLEPYGTPHVDLKKMEIENNEFEFSVKVPLKPQVEIGEYKGLHARKPAIDVTDEEVDAYLERVRQGKAKREAVTERGVEEGDVAVLNIKEEGVEGEGQTFMTVAGKTFPQLDTAIMGMKAEEIKHVSLTFPESFEDKKWAGRTVNSIVTIRSLSTLQAPELSDEFAQEFEHDSLDKLRDTIRTGMTRMREDQVREIVYQQIMQELREKSTVHVPDTMWEHVARQRLSDIESDQKSKDRTLEQYAEENGMTLDELKADNESTAKIYVQEAQLVQEIFLAEKMSLSNQELNNELVAMAREYEIPPEELLAILKKNESLQELHHRAIHRKVMQFLVENAEIEEVNPQ